MKLIDANKLVVDARFGEDEIPYVSKAQIDEAPTIEAVPVEWLMKHIMIGYVFATIVIDEWRKENKNENIS